MCLFAQLNIGFPLKLNVLKCATKGVSTAVDLTYEENLRHGPAWAEFKAAVFHTEVANSNQAESLWNFLPAEFAFRQQLPYKGNINTQSSQCYISYKGNIANNWVKLLKIGI